MAKILVLSDSHGSHDVIDEVISKELPFDELIFCGDGIDDLLGRSLPKKFILHYVTGNVDRARGLQGERELVLDMHGQKIFVTHGDCYAVKESLHQVREAGLRKKADIVIFGHTHIQFEDATEKPLMLNPGCARNCSYAILEINESSIDIYLRSI